MATPKSDVCQSVGRILRSKHSQPLVIDIIDTHDIFKRQYLKRKTYYHKKKYIIQRYLNLNEYKQDIFTKDEKKTSRSKLTPVKCLLKIPDNVS